MEKIKNPWTKEEIKISKAVLLNESKRLKKQRAIYQNNSTNVIDITARLKAKQNQEEANIMLEKFKNDYLPFMSIEDAQEIAEANDNGKTLAKICFKIDFEKMLQNK